MPKEEDQVRWQAPGVYALHQLQDRLRFHPGREEEEPAKGVRLTFRLCVAVAGQRQLTTKPRAKYIEGLENRLGRMESLLRLSGTIGALDKRCSPPSIETRC